MARDRAEAARRKIKRAGGLIREAAAELAALEAERDVLAELELEHPTDLPQAAELLELALAQYGPVRLLVARAGRHPTTAPTGRAGDTA